MEQVLVVNRAALEARLGPGPFLSQNLETIRQFILDHHTFLPREQAEYDNTVRQIIPYVILRRGRHYFLLRRLKKQTETRLHEKLSLGVGGHINPTGEVTVRETEKMSGSWASPQELSAVFDRLETWSQIVLEEVISPNAV